MNTAQIEYLDFSRTANVGVVNAEINSGFLCQSEQQTAELMLYHNGTIRECTQAAAELLDCSPSKLIWQHISTIMPQLGETTLMQGERVSPNLRFLSHIGYGFEVIGVNGVHFSCALFFNEVENFGRHCLRLIIRPITQDLVAS
jgi:predicted glutamine amidotransferase